MDFDSNNNLLWDQNIIAHNLEYNINAELQGRQAKPTDRGMHARPAQPLGQQTNHGMRDYARRETFVGGRHTHQADPLDSMIDNTVSSIDRDLTDMFGKNWQFMFLIIVIAVCVIQYVHYQHVTANLTSIIKLFMCQSADQEFNAAVGQMQPSAIQPVRLPTAPQIPNPASQPAKQPSS